MNRQHVEQVPGEAFQCIAGQERAVARVKAIVDQELRGDYPAKKPILLYLGPSGSGKSIMVEETAKALGATLVVRGSTSFLSEGGINFSLMGKGYDEARHAAGNKRGGKAVYFLDDIDKVMKIGRQPVVGQYLSELMTGWSTDRQGGVLVIAVAIDRDFLPDPVLTRFTVIPIEPLDQNGMEDLCKKVMTRLAREHGRPDIFEAISVPDIASLATEIKRLGWVPRNVTNFLREAIASGTPIGYDFLSAQLPKPPRRTGFVP